MASIDLEIQKAVYSALTADSTLMALIGGVFDFVPEDEGLNYVTIGECDLEENDSKTGQGFIAYIQVDTWTSYAGRATCKTIMGEVYRVLHNGSLTISGFVHIRTMFENSTSFRDETETMYHGVQNFKIYAE